MAVRGHVGHPLGNYDKEIAGNLISQSLQPSLPNKLTICNHLILILLTYLNTLTFKNL